MHVFAEVDIGVETGGENVVYGNVDSSNVTCLETKTLEDA